MIVVEMFCNFTRYMLDNGSLAFNEVFHEKGGNSDKGDYQCLATVDGLGTIVSRMATLDVACESCFFLFFL